MAAGHLANRCQGAWADAGAGGAEDSGRAWYGRVHRSTLKAVISSSVLSSSVNLAST